MTEVKAITGVVTGKIPWKTPYLYSGMTPICFEHYTEMVEYITKIGEALDTHRAYKSYVAHPAVNLEYPGFITPELIAEINDIKSRIAALNSVSNKRIPQGIIGMFDGSVSSVPSGWELDTSVNGKFIIGASSSNTYPIHTPENQDSSAISNLFTESNMPNHSHSFENCFFAEANGYSTYQNKSFGASIGSNDSDWDNSVLYFDDYSDYAGTDVSQTQFSTIEPKYIQIPFIKKSYDKVNVKVTISGNIYVNGSNSVTSIAKGTIVNLTGGSGVKTIYANGYSRTLPCKYCVTKDVKFSTSK